ncbi:MAG: hypothetical protein WKG00_41405 [Polyangiaceae bacterium]
MDPRDLRDLLEQVRGGQVPVEAALESLRELPFRDLGFATIDHHRALRQGVPEVIFGERKSAEQIAGIAGEIVRAGQNVLVTRLDADKARLVAQAVPSFEYRDMARVGVVEIKPIPSGAAHPWPWSPPAPATWRSPRRPTRRCAWWASPPPVSTTSAWPASTAS